MQIIGELVDPDLRYWVGRYGGVFVLGSIGVIAASIYHWKWNALTLAFALLLLSTTVFLRHPITYWMGSYWSYLLFVASLPLTVIGLSIASRRKHIAKNELVLLITLVWFILWVSLSRSGKRYDFFIGVPLALGTAFLLRYITSSFNVNKSIMTAPKAKALGFFSSFSVLNFGRWASFAYCDMLLGFYRVFVWLFQRIENSPSDLINLSNVEVAPARGAATGFLLSPN